MTVRQFPRHPLKGLLELDDVLPTVLDRRSPRLKYQEIGRYMLPIAQYRLRHRGYFPRPEKSPGQRHRRGYRISTHYSRNSGCNSHYGQDTKKQYGYAHLLILMEVQRSTLPPNQCSTVAKIAIFCQLFRLKQKNGFKFFNLLRAGVAIGRLPHNGGGIRPRRRTDRISYKASRQP